MAFCVTYFGTTTVFLSLGGFDRQKEGGCPVRTPAGFFRKGNDLWKLSPEIFRERCASCPFFFSLFGCYRNTKIHQPFLFRMRFAVVQVDLERQAAALATMLVY